MKAEGTLVYFFKVFPFQKKTFQILHWLTYCLLVIIFLTPCEISTPIFVKSSKIYCILLYNFNVIIANNLRDKLPIMSYYL